MSDTPGHYQSTINSKYKLIEKLYERTRTDIYRALKLKKSNSIETSSSETVRIEILRSPDPHFNDLIYLYNWYSIVKDLTIPHVVKVLALEPKGNTYALVMEDPGAITLRDYLLDSGNLSVKQGLEIAIVMADILHDLNIHRVLHKNINPTSILIHPGDRQIWLTDFSIASLLPRETQITQIPQNIEGRLAYIAPEQTGRMNRGIDFRTDFYSLGITLYELLTHRLPFQSEDAIKLMYCHLAKNPVSPHVVNAEIPLPLSAIVLKLMAKNAEDRYQSAAGLKHDLEVCLHQLNNHQEIEEFELGQEDRCDRLIISERLYGREAEVKILLDSFERVARGTTELMLVAGFSGIGKTALINEVHKPIAKQKGYFIKGKFEQFNRNIPFSGFIRAFSNLIKHLLAESDRELSQWKQKILDALGDNAQVIIEFIPELELVLGKQPAVEKLSGSTAQNRFNLFFNKFIQVFAVKDRPLVIFLDDLQWADSASLSLLQLLITESKTNANSLLILGAYRDNEVFPTHPLMLRLSEIEQEKNCLNTITLEPLAESDINCLVADTLLCNQTVAAPLFSLIYQKTQGNPFFTTQFLKGLYEDGQIYFNRFDNYWQCDLSQIKQLVLIDDVVEFMVSRLKKLPEKAQEVLKLAACIGNQFDLATLSIVCRSSEVEITNELWSVLQAGLIIPITEIYRLFESEQIKDNPPQFEIEYKFLHDRIQQAAYCLISPEQQQSIHLFVAHSLLQHYSPEVLQEKIFVVVQQLNLGRIFIEDIEEKLAAAQLNLQAGNKALLSTAYEAALDYFSIGRSLLAESDWQKNYDLCLELHLKLMEAHYLNGNYQQIEDLANLIFEQASSFFDRVRAYELLALTKIGQKKLLEAIEIGSKALSLINIKIPPDPTVEETQKITDEVSNLLNNRKFSELIQHPEMTNPEAIAAMRVLNTISVPAYLTSDKLFLVVVLTQVKLSIEQGNCAISASAYARYGIALCGASNQIELGCQSGKLALQLLEKFDNAETKTRTLLMVGNLVSPWQQHLRTSISLLQNAYETGLNSGNFEPASLARLYESQLRYLAGEPLAELGNQLNLHGDCIRHLKQELHLSFHEILLKLVNNLKSTNSSPALLATTVQEEKVLLKNYEDINYNFGLFGFYFYKATINYLLDRSQVAQELITKAKDYISGVTSQPVVPLLAWYDCLIFFSLNNSNNQSGEREISFSPIEQNIKDLSQWAELAPMNFQHKYDLIEAEKNRILANRFEAGELYDRAIIGAKENEYIQEEALANELAAKFYLDWGKERVAAGYMQEAYCCYDRWGAKAKTNHLKENYPALLRPLPFQNRAFNPLETLSSFSSLIDSDSQSQADFSLNDSFDLTAILKSAQALTSTLEVDELLKQLSQIILQNSGCDRLIIALADNTDTWHIDLVADPEKIEFVAESLKTDAHHPLRLINYVKNTQEIVLVDNLKTDLPILDDYLLETQPQSLFALPLKYDEKTIGVLYLHSSYVRGLFNRGRIIVLEFLCSQASIALHNARLYADANLKSKVIESSIDGMAILENGIFLYLNERHALLSGYQPEELIGQSWKKLYSLKEANRIQPELFASLEDTAEWSGETTALRKDGTTFAEEVRIFALDNGKLICICRDISQRKKTERDLVASEERFKELFKQNVDAFVLWGQDGLLDCNQAAVELFGYQDKSQLLHLKPYHLSPKTQPDGRSSWEKSEEMCQQAIKKGSHKFEWVYQKLSGENFWAEVNITVIYYHDELIFHSIVRNISDRKKLQQEQKRLIDILETTSDYIGFADRQGNILWHNKPLRELRPDISIGAEKHKVASCHPQWVNEMFAKSAMPEAIRSNTWLGEAALLDEQGKEIPVSQVFIAHKNDEGEAEYFSTIMRDISDRKAAELALKQSENKFRTLVANVHGAVYRCLHDTSWSMDFISSAVEDLTGYRADEFMQNKTRNFASIVHPDDLDLINRNVDEAIANHHSFAYEYRIIHRDGSIHWVLERGKGIYDSTGNFQYIEGVIFDISDRKASEKALEISALRDQTIFDQASVGFIEIDIKTQKLTRVNNLFCQMTGYSAEELSQMDFQALTHPEDLENCLKLLEQLISGETDKFFTEKRFLNKNGSYFWCETTAYPIEFEGNSVKTIFGIIKDISDRKIAEQSLIESENKFRTLVGNVEGAVYRGLTDYDLTMDYISPAIEQLSGYCADELIANHTRSYQSIIHPEDQDLVWQQIEEAVKNDRVFLLEYRLIHRNGDIRWVSERGKVVYNESKGVEYLEGVIFDISDRKRYEQKILESRTFLQTILNTFPLAIFWKDRQSKYLGINQNFARDAGFQQTEDVIGLTDFDLPWTESEAEAYRTDDLAVMESNSPKLDIIETLVKADGTQIWLETNKLPLHDLEGNVIGVMGTYQDISDRHKLEQELQLSEALSRAAFEQAAVGILEADTKTGKYTRINNYFCEMIGYSRIELEQLSFADFTHPDDVAESEKFARQLYRGEIDNFTIEKRYVRKDESFFWSATTVSLINLPEGKSRRCLAIVKDISDRKAAEAALKLSEARAKASFEQAAVGIGESDIETGFFTRVNEHFCRMTGYTQSELSKLSVEDLTHHQDFPKSKEYLQKLDNGEIDNFTIEKRYIGKNGSIFWAATTVCLVDIPGEKARRTLGIVKDISDRKKAEAALKLSEARARASFEQAAVGICESEIGNDHMTKVNQHLCQMTGYTQSEFLSLSVKDLTYPEDLAESQKNIQRLYSREVDNFTMEKRYIRKDRSFFWSATTVSLVDVPGEKTLRCLIIVKDISDRKEAENALLQQQSHMAALLDNIPHMAWIKDQQSRFIAVNKPFAKACGISIEDIIGKTDYDIWSRELAQKYRDDDFQVLSSGKRKVLEEKIALTDGTVGWLETTKTPFKDTNGELAGTVGIAADLTLRKQAELALAQSETKFRTLVENARDIIFSMTAEGVFTYVSPQVEQILGYPAEQLIGQNCLLFSHPDDIPLVTDCLKTAVEQGTTVVGKRIRMPHVNGGWRWVVFNNTPVKNISGQIISIQGIGRDVTETEQKEQALTAIVEGTAAKTGADFYRSCVRYLAEIFQVEHGFIAEFNRESPLEATMLVLWNGREYKDPYVMDLTATPCLKTRNQGIYIARDSLNKLFPEANELVLLTMKSYASTTIVNSQGESIGNLGIMDSKPLPYNTSTIEFILQLFATRIGAEMERQKTEDALRKSQTQLLTFIDNSPAAIFQKDLQGRYQILNQTLADLFELDRDTFINQTDRELFPEDIVRQIRKIDREVIVSQTSSTLEEIISHPDGSIHTYLTNKFPLLDEQGQVYALGGVSTDITDLKTAELALKESQAQFKKTTENIPGMIYRCVLHPDGTNEMTYVSSQVREIFELEPEAVIEDGGCQMWERTHPDDLARVKADIQISAKTLQPLQNEHRLILPKKGLRWIQAIARPERLANGDVVWDGVVLDISDRKQAELALQESQVQFQRMTENVPGMIFRYVVHADGSDELTYVSSQIEEIFEVESKTALQNADSMWARIHPDDLPHINNDVKISAETLQPFTSAYRLILPNKGLRWVQNMSCPERLDNGDVVWDGITVDISDRKLIEAEQRRHLAILESTSDFIGTSNPHGKILYLNQAWRNLLDKDTEEPCHRTSITEQHPAWALEIVLNEAFPEAEHKGMWSGETAVLDGNGIEIPVSQVVIAHKSRDGEVEYFSTIVRDISDRKKAEAQLQIISDRLEIAIQSANIGIWEWDFQSDRLSWNDRMFAIYGVQPEDFAGTCQDWSKHVHPDDLDSALIKPELFDCLSSITKEFRIVRTDGEVRYIYSTASIQKNQQGQLVRSVGVNIDLTDRKLVEEELQRINEKLVHATRMKDDFLANMSHELRTPLNAILGMAEGLQEGIFGKLNQEQDKALDTIEQSGSHLLELIDEILDLTKIESGRVELEYSPVEVNQLCQSSLTFIKQQAQKKLIQLHLNTPFNLPKIAIDQRRIRQVLINLLNNAVKFTPEGGSVTLKVTILDPEKTSDLKYLRFAVKDTGIGIAQKDFEKLFQPFVQIDSSLNRQYEGTGLGLFLVKRIIDLHQGYVTVTSKVGIGSYFAIDLPYSTIPNNNSINLLETTSSPNLDNEQDTRSTTPLILIAEDNNANSSIISMYLQTKGYRIQIAHNGQSAVELAQTKLPNIILMDIQMPGMDGLTAIKHIRQYSSLSQIPIIALTAFAMEEDRKKCLAAGANMYLAKPVRLKKLVLSIKKLLANQPITD